LREAFENCTMKPERLQVVRFINSILADYERQGYTLSVRQVFYQLVSRNVVKNSMKMYNFVQSLVSDGRLCGLIDWAIIEDRGRSTTFVQHYRDPADLLRSEAPRFRINKWERQPNYVEVFVEKAALEGILEPLCMREDVPFTSNRGYTSQTAIYDAAKRYENQYSNGKQCYAIYLGDHDPSGLDMTRDMKERLTLLSNQTPITVRRVALNMPQIHQYSPPPNPAKFSDSRAGKYVAQFGASSWELDALNPNTLAGITQKAIHTLRNDVLWNEDVAKERNMINELVTMANNYKGTGA
jgi:hypothetical protein